MHITNYKSKALVSSGNAQEVELLEGVSASTIIKCLEVIAGAGEAVIEVYRKKTDGTLYGKIVLNLAASDYVLLWEGFVVIPAGEKLYFKADSPDVELVASVVEL